MSLSKPETALLILGHGSTENPDSSQPCWDHAETIAATASKGKYDMLVRGSHGHGSLGSLVLGSVASKVLAQCTTPVLLVR